MRILKKALSALCAASMVISACAFTVSADTSKPTIKVTLDYTTLNVGDTITVKYSYEGFNDITYNDDEGVGRKLVSIQWKGIIPGLNSGSDAYFGKAGAVTKLSSSTIAISPNYSVTTNENANFIAAVAFSDINDAPTASSGDLYSVKIKIKKEIDKDLVFGFDTIFNTTASSRAMVDWEEDFVSPDAEKIYNDIVLESATIPSQKQDDPDPAATDAVKGKEFHDGYQAYSAPEAFTIPAEATSLDYVFEKTDAAAVNDTIDLNTGVVGAGTTKLLPIITYKIGQNGVAAGDVFTLTIKNGATTVGAWTFTAE